MSNATQKRWVQHSNAVLRAAGLRASAGPHRRRRAARPPDLPADGAGDRRPAARGGQRRLDGDRLPRAGDAARARPAAPLRRRRRRALRADRPVRRPPPPHRARGDRRRRALRRRRARARDRRHRPAARADRHEPRHHPARPADRRPARVRLRAGGRGGRLTSARAASRRSAPRGERPAMRHRPLHAALSAFAEEAAWPARRGDRRRRRGPVRDHRVARRPARHAAVLLPPADRDASSATARACSSACRPTRPRRARWRALDGVGDYLREQSEPRVPAEPRERADIALRVFISRVFSEATEFVITPERFDRAYRELEDALLEGHAEAVVVAPLLGLQLVSAEVPLGQGLSLIRGDELPDAPAEAVWPGGADEPCVLACLTLTDDPGAPAPLDRGRRALPPPADRAAPLRPAARRARPGRLAAHAARGRGRSAASGTSGRASGVLLIGEAAEDELRAFCNLIARRTPRAGELAWALRRFELGCERPSAFEALTDHLLALRALLEPEGPQSGRLAGRVAALCATPEQRLRDHRARRARRVAGALDHRRPGADRRRRREAARRDHRPPARAAARRALRPPGLRPALGGRPAAGGGGRRRGLSPLAEPNARRRTRQPARCPGTGCSAPAAARCRRARGRPASRRSCRGGPCGRGSRHARTRPRRTRPATRGSPATRAAGRRRPVRCRPPAAPPRSE